MFFQYPNDHIRYLKKKYEYSDIQLRKVYQYQDLQLIKSYGYHKKTGNKSEYINYTKEEITNELYFQVSKFAFTILFWISESMLEKIWNVYVNLKNIKSKIL